MLIKLLLLVAVVTQRVLASARADDLLITLPDGPIQGATYVTSNNKTYYGFRGIPFATPPLGNLRFEAPQSPQPWDTILYATSDSKACISITSIIGPENESEDCLYINVYTPSLKPAKKLPVLFWIYGGGFTSGTSVKSFYGPDFLIEEDVIMVSHNYRVGPFGFLSTGDTSIRGNAGLKDQNLALKWTHDNIALFGGDPDKITIFGQSAGAHSSGHHLISKKSAGLFRGAILESGSTLVSHSIHMDPRSYAFALADAIPGGTYGNDSQKLKEFLLEQPTDVILNATNSLPSDQQVYPVVEVEGDDAFLTENPYVLLESGRFNHVPMIIGICAEESLMFLQTLEKTKEKAHLYDTIPNSTIPINLRPNSSDYDAINGKIKNMYLPGSKLFSEDLVAVAEYFSDNQYTRGIIKHAELSSYYVPVYLYQFAYYGRVITPAFIDGAEKATHSAELPFIFQISGFEDTDAANLVVQNRMVKLWTNFAKFLNPTPDESELFNYVTWNSVTPTEQPFLNINGTVEIRYNLKGKTYHGWNEIYDVYGKKPFITY